jgi:hypothetical protein
MSLIDDAKSHIESAVTGLRGEDDFMPFLLTRRVDEINYVGIAGMADEYKDDIAAMMFAVIVVDRAQEAVFGCASWFVVAPRNPDGSLPPGFDVAPSQHPDRIEVAHLIHVTPDGDALHVAKLHRRNNRVLLGAWEDPAHNAGGRFGRALHNGLRMATAQLPPELLAAITGDRDMAIRAAASAYHKQEKAAQ